METFTSVLRKEKFIRNKKLYKNKKHILMNLEIANFLLGLGLTSSNNNCGFNKNGMNDIIKIIIDKLQEEQNNLKNNFYSSFKKLTRKSDECYAQVVKRRGRRLIEVLDEFKNPRICHIGIVGKKRQNLNPYDIVIINIYFIKYNLCPDNDGFLRGEVIFKYSKNDIIELEIMRELDSKVFYLHSENMKEKKKNKNMQRFIFQ